MQSYLISKTMDKGILSIIYGWRIEVQRGWERGPMSDDELMAELELELRSSNLHPSYSFASAYMAVRWEDREEQWAARLGEL